MPRIVLNLNDSLEVNGDGELAVKKSLKAGNTVQINSDGLYAQAVAGGGSGTPGGYPDRYRSNNGVLSGVTTPYNTNATSKRIVSPAITHCIFTCNSDDGSDIVIRNGVDFIYPGDMYRVLDSENDVYKYYLILKTDGSQVISHSAVVATIPISVACN